MSIYVELIAYFGGFFLSINMIPQIYETYVNKSAKEISYIFLVLNLLGLGLYCTYGFIKDLMEIYITILFTFFLTCIMIILKFYYSSN